MDECTVRSTTTDDSSKELDNDNAPTVVELKSSSGNVVSDEEYKDVNEATESIKELNGLKSNDLDKQMHEAESQLNDLSLNDKKDSLSKRTDDGSEDEYYDVTSDGSNVDSELSSHEEEHKSADENDEVLNEDWEDDEPQQKQPDNEDELNREDQLDKSKDEREQGDGEVSGQRSDYYFFF